MREYDHIQRVCTARNNLEATARVLANFRTIPTRAKALLNELDDVHYTIKCANTRQIIIIIILYNDAHIVYIYIYP